MEDLNFIYRRRSIRKFTDQPVTDEVIELLLKAAMAAPTAMNIQSWRFIVIRDAELLRAIRRVMPFGKMEAPCAVSVCGDLQSLRRLVAERFWVQDCSAATENLLLAASALGLGAVWCGVEPLNQVSASISKLLKLPEHIRPLNIIYIGFPAEEKPARTQYDPKKVFLDQFGSPWMGPQS